MGTLWEDEAPQARKPKLRTNSDWLTPREVQTILGCHARTLIRWAEAGIVHYFRTPGGHRRYLAEDIWRMYRTWRPGGRRAKKRAES